MEMALDLKNDENCDPNWSTVVSKRRTTDLTSSRSPLRRLNVQTYDPFCWDNSSLLTKRSTSPASPPKIELSAVGTNFGVTDWDDLSLVRETLQDLQLSEAFNGSDSPKISPLGNGSQHLSNTGHLSSTGHLSNTVHLSNTGHLSITGHLSNTGHLSRIGHLCSGGLRSRTKWSHPRKRSHREFCKPKKVPSIPDCDTDELMCTDGSCVKLYQLCDDRFDCAYWADKCKFRTGIDQCKGFICLDDSRCMRWNQVGDQHMNCFDGSDEFNCELPPPNIEMTCPAQEFMCSHSHQCVMIFDCCDRVQECDDSPTNWSATEN